MAEKKPTAVLAATVVQGSHGSAALPPKLAATSTTVAPTPTTAAATPTAAAVETAPAPSSGRSSSASLVERAVASLPSELLQHFEDSAQQSTLQQLRQERKELAKQRAALSAQMRNEERKRQRLVKNAQKLTFNELLEVFAYRQKQAESSSAAKPAARTDSASGKEASPKR